VLKPDNTAVLTHVVEVQDEATNAWFEAFVDAATGELVSVTDFVAKASYRVLPIWKQIPTDGFETLVNPEDKTASPYGWLSTNNLTFNNFTAGNNAVSAVGSATARSTGPSEFFYHYVNGGDPYTSSQKNASVVNAFYVINAIHDIAYKYGFTEATFNFQQTNIVAAGKGNDRVVIHVQDNALRNGAEFATPPDGFNGRLQLWLWTAQYPDRDGAIENDIVAHEMAHGITNRCVRPCISLPRTS
jgi:extracellular elastinolytic metalloproteinase